MSTVGEALVTYDSNDKLIIHEATLKRFVTNDRIKDLPLAIISVCGPPSSGKSTLLDFFFRYIRYRYNYKEDEDDTDASDQQAEGDVKLWITLENQSLERAKWPRDIANGILIWPDVAICRTKTKGPIAVLFMEIHGSYDKSDDSWKWMNTFLLSSLMSSVQIYNVGTLLQKEHVEALGLLCDYGKEVKKITQKQALMKFHFLVRDCTETKSNKIGSWGGFMKLDKITRRRIIGEELSYRAKMKNTFSEVGCFLMPGPEGSVSEEEGRVNLEELSDLFLYYMNNFILMLASPSKIEPKDVCGQRLKTKYFESYLRAYITEAFKSSQIPSVAELLLASSKASHEVAKLDVIQLYLERTHYYCHEACTMDPAELQGMHGQSRVMALDLFLAAYKLGGDAFTDSYKDQVEEELEKMFALCTKKNWQCRLKYHLINRMTVALLTIVLISTAWFVVSKIMGRSNDMKRAVTMTTLFCVLLVSWLIFQYRKVL